MIVKLQTEHHLEFLSLKGGCRGSSESTLVKMSNCWKSNATAQLINTLTLGPFAIFGTRDLFNISYSRELYLFLKFLHFEEIVCVKMAVCFEMIVSET